MNHPGSILYASSILENTCTTVGERLFKSHHYDWSASFSTPSSHFSGKLDVYHLDLVVGRICVSRRFKTPIVGFRTS
jgi:hypothetical protein